MAAPTDECATCPPGQGARARAQVSRIKQRWGLKARYSDNLIRFFAFSALHLVNYVTNVAIVIHVWPAVHEEFAKAGYVIILGFAQLLVGIYCVFLAWGDADIKRYSRQCLGLLGHIVITLFLGFTQLIQLKVAWGKYTRRQIVEREGGDDDDDEDGEDEGVPNQDRERQAAERRRRVAFLENIIPWTFPSKCLEGMFEGVAFALVELYIVLKIGWDDDPIINDLFDADKETGWYVLITVSGILSFTTIGVSMLNFDYHLSPAVQKTIDHSLRYTLIHLIFRACEVGTRLSQIIIFVLAFRPCNSTVMRSVPYVCIALDYGLCSVTLFYLSAPEERRYPGLRSICGFVKRLTCSLVVGLLLFFANLAEFVDAVERGLLRDAAHRFSLAVRTWRCVELILLIICLSVEVREKDCLVPWTPQGEKEPRLSDMWVYSIRRHYVIFAAAVLATLVYYVLLCCGFHHLVSRSTEDLMQTYIGRLSQSIFCLPRDQSRDAALVEPQQPRPDVAPGAAPLLDNPEQGGSQCEQLPATGAGQRGINLQIIVAQDSDLPRALSMSDGQPANDTFYHNVIPQVRVRRAPSLSFLLLSRGVHGSVANNILATINEDDVLPTDLVTYGSRVQMADFELMERLGRGAYAPVFRVRKKGSGEIFAMKRLVKHNYVARSNVEAALPRRERDTLFLAGRHPYVAGLHYAFETDTFWVLVTEYCALGALSKYLRKKGRPGLAPQMVATLGGHVLQGLAHLHENYILHRDIKPDNIGISGTDAEPIAKLLDFGFAKRADKNQSRTIVGSFGYCAPEIDNARHVFGALRQSNEFFTQRIDLYSFGVVLFVLLVGREADLNGDLWTHRQLREMLRDRCCPLWRCQRYSDLGINAADSLRMLHECGGFVTVSKLTETQAIDRPSTARCAGLLPLFTRHPGSIPAGWPEELESSRTAARSGAPAAAAGWATAAPEDPTTPGTDAMLEDGVQGLAGDSEHPSARSNANSMAANGGSLESEGPSPHHG